MIEIDEVSVIRKCDQYSELKDNRMRYGFAGWAMPISREKAEGLDKRITGHYERHWKFEKIEI